VSKGSLVRQGLFKRIMEEEREGAIAAECEVQNQRRMCTVVGTDKIRQLVSQKSR
jgi:hypothetical protein